MLIYFSTGFVKNFTLCMTKFWVLVFCFSHVMDNSDVNIMLNLGFLAVSHTHENIDWCFGYLSKKLKKQNNYISVDFDEGFYGLTKVTFHSTIDSKDFRFLNLSPKFFKGWPWNLVMHINGHIFRFFYWFVQLAYDAIQSFTYR